MGSGVIDRLLIHFWRQGSKPDLFFFFFFFRVRVASLLLLFIIMIIFFCFVLFLFGKCEIVSSSWLYPVTVY